MNTSNKLPEAVEKAIEAEKIRLSEIFRLVKQTAVMKEYARGMFIGLEKGAEIALSRPVENGGEIEERMREAVDSAVYATWATGDDGTPDPVVKGKQEATKAVSAICHEVIASLQAENERLKGEVERMGRQRIETAPRNDTNILLFTEGHQWLEGYYSEDNKEWTVIIYSRNNEPLQSFAVNPSHWMPISPAPTQSEPENSNS